MGGTGDRELATAAAAAAEVFWDLVVMLLDLHQEQVEYMEAAAAVTALGLRMEALEE